MTQENVELSGMQSKFTKIALTVITMLLLFAGPTYVPYLLEKSISFEANVVVGGVLFFAGLGMLIFLVRKKIIS
jgi:uncharacterized membrane protein YgdD (TMEM256/DUF423 family)